jgi:hypothetical protein
MENENLALDITGDFLQNVAPDEGAPYERKPWGDFRFKIVTGKTEAKKGENPHVMLRLGFQILAVLDINENPEAANAVGMVIEGLYAGSQRSPKKMQKRLAHIVSALKLPLQAGKPLTSEMFTGREFDGSVVWELSDEQFDATSGASKRYVNERVIGERPAGTPRSQKINPKIQSAYAIKYVEMQGNADMGGDMPGGVEPAPMPWAQEGAQAETQVQTEAASFRPETAEEKPSVHHYRALVKLGSPNGAQLRDALVGLGVDPDGEIDPAVLPAELRTSYLAKFPQASTGTPTLPGLGGLPPLGGAPNSGAAKPRTGTRTPPQRA